MILSNQYINSNVGSVSGFNRSEHMKLLHASGRYTGTSKIGIWNQSEEKRQRMREIRERNLLNKESHGYGSEYHMRLANKTLLHNKFQGDRGFMYLLEFPGSIKVGFSKDWERRTNRELFHTYLGGRVILIISGPTSDLADLEFDTMIQFQKYTQLDSTKTRYTEFLDKREKRNVYNFLKSRVTSDSNLKIEIENSL